MITHASLFTGIGGFDIAAEWMGWKNVFQCEWDKYCMKLLEQNFPNTDKYGDITKTDFRKYRGSIDVLTGGFPCQPFSLAGKREGEKDERYLWQEMLRCVQEVRPSVVVGENVTGLLSMDNGKTFDSIWSDLENEGYTVESFVIPACSVGAWHRRDRVWIIAYSRSSRTGNKIRGRNRQRRESCEKFQSKVVQGRETQNQVTEGGCENASNTYRVNGNDERYGPSNVRQQKPEGIQQEFSSNTIGQGLERLPWHVKKGSESRRINEKPSGSIGSGGICSDGGIWDSEPRMGRVANGIPKRVDRIKGLGNAVVPQLVYEIFEVIEQQLWET